MRLAMSGGVYVPKFYDVDYLDDGRIRRVVPNRPGVPWRVHKHTLMDLDQWPYPSKPLVPLAETVHERYSVEIFRGCTRGVPVLSGRDDHPAGPGAVDHHDRRHGRQGDQEVRVRGGRPAVAVVGRPSEIAEVAKGLAERFEGTNVSLSLPSTRVDAFNITFANEFSRNGRWSGLTFAPEGGSERLGKVINKAS